jgi:phytoene dehydrogenase-like protein
VSDRFEVVVVGGGHNGLVAAALLAKRGASVTVVEAREKVGGAATTEQPWGPDYKVTALSYVVSLMPPTVRTELDLERHGLKIHPQNGYFVPYRDGRSLLLPDDPKRRREEIGQFSATDADAEERWHQWLGDLAGVLGPLLMEIPPTLGSRRPSDLLAQARLGWHLRRLGATGVAEATRLFTASIADIVESFFESPQLQAVHAVSGIIGTWAGPCSAGTAFVMAHHQIGDLGDGHVGAWGFPEGGMGAVSEAMRRAAESFGVTVRTEAPVTRIEVRDGRATGVVLASGEELVADVVVAATHPEITFRRQIERRHLPDDFAEAIDRWRSRSGTVKVNLALDRLPEFTSRPGFDPEVHGGTIVLAESLTDLEGAFQDAAAGRPAGLPFADVCIPSVFDRTLAPEGHHVMSMFTQWVPHTWVDRTDPGDLDAHADRVIARMEGYAPGFADSILHRQVIGPKEMADTYGLVGGNIFHGELAADQLFHLRPAPGYADFRTPIAGLYQASSATHGGGGVTGIPGLQAARQVMKDRRGLARARRRTRPRAA